MQLLIGLSVLVAGILIVWFSRPAAGGRMAAFAGRPIVGDFTAFVTTAMIALGIGFTVTGFFQIIW